MSNSFAKTLLSASGFNWYGFLIGGGMVICIVIAWFMGKKRGFYPDLVFDLAICTLPCAIVGARLYYIIFDLIENPDAVWTFRKIIGLEGGLSGLAIYGGLIGAVLGSLITVAIQKKKPEPERVSWLQMADLAFTVIILGQVIGRWGNFANQEAYGNPVTDKALQWFPYAVYIERANSVTGRAGWFQATFFYESMWNLIGFGLLMWAYMGKRKSFDGFILSAYCIWYGFGRFFIEGLRTDSLWLIPDAIRVSQLVSVIIFFFGIGMIIYHLYKAAKANKRPFVFVPESELSFEVYGYEKSIFYRRTLVDKTAAEPKKKSEPTFEGDDEEVAPEDRYWEVKEDYREEESLTEKYFGKDGKGDKNE